MKKTKLAIAVIAALIATTAGASADWYHHGWHRPHVMGLRAPVVVDPWFRVHRHRGWWHRDFHHRWW